MFIMKMIKINEIKNSPEDDLIIKRLKKQRVYKSVLSTGVKTL